MKLIQLIGRGKICGSRLCLPRGPRRTSAGHLSFRELLEARQQDQGAQGIDNIHNTVHGRNRTPISDHINMLW